jgi:hypothetical protein
VSLTNEKTIPTKGIPERASQGGNAIDRKLALKFKEWHVKPTAQLDRADAGPSGDPADDE